MSDFEELNNEDMDMDMSININTEDAINTVMSIAAHHSEEYGTGDNYKSDLYSEEDIEKATSITRLFNSIGNEPLLTQEEVNTLIEEIKSNGPNAKKAKDTMIYRNMRLVVFIAKNHYSHVTIPMDDLIQEGTIGLMTAVDRYDPTLGYAFSTYATYWIRQAISRYITNTSRTIRLPVHVIEKFIKYQKIEKDLFQRLGHEPSVQELAEALNLPESKVKEYLRYNNKVLSYNIEVGKSGSGEEGDTELIDFVQADEENTDPYILTKRKMLEETFAKILSSKVFTQKEREVLIRRTGLFGYPEETLQTIGEDLGVSRERIRQIEVKARRKLASPRNKRRLRDFFYTD